MTQVTIITEVARTIDATADHARRTFLVDAGLLPDVLGWELRPSGLCNESTCVPVADAGSLQVGGSSMSSRSPPRSAGLRWSTWAPA